MGRAAGWCAKASFPRPSAGALERCWDEILAVGRSFGAAPESGPCCPQPAVTAIAQAATSFHPCRIHARSIAIPPRSKTSCQSRR